MLSPLHDTVAIVLDDYKVYISQRNSISPIVEEINYL